MPYLEQRGALTLACVALIALVVALMVLLS
jgi:hypothetical protein